MKKDKKTFFMKNKKAALAVIGITLLGIVAMNVGGHNAVASPPPMAMQAMPVKVKTLVPKKAQIWSNFSGRLEAVDKVDIRPQVSGTIKEIKFHDGAVVKQGDVLFVIDPEPYQAAKDRADAALSAAETQAALAKHELERAQGLIKSGAITKQLLDQRANARRVADAAVRSAKAEVRQAQINLDYAYVKAPIAGRVSRAELTIGNLVQAGPSSPVLTKIVSSAGIYADFEVDEQTYIRAVRQHAQANDVENMVPVELQLKSDDSKSYHGSIHAFDNHIDPATGTIRARALFENTDGVLIPGMFATVRMGTLVSNESLMVPEKAIGTDQNRKYVYVAVDGKASYREVKLGANADGERVVVSGLQAGDKVIVDGLQHVRPDAPVDAKEDVAETAAPAKAEPVAEKPADTPAPAAE